MTEYFLGIDGGQSHTTALLADARGVIAGRGQAGESNHTRAPGGRERLEQAVVKSTYEAMKQAGLAAGDLAYREQRQQVRAFRFASAHLAMTGEPADKTAIVGQLLTAALIEVGHDAPGALMGALPETDLETTRIIILSGTGSVAVGEKNGQRTRIGGRGYMFSDDGSGFAIAREALRQALRGADRGAEDMELRDALLTFFRRTRLQDIAEDFYAGEISHEQLAGFARELDKLAQLNNAQAVHILTSAARELVEMVTAAATGLNASSADALVSYSGGVFRSELVMRCFAAGIAETLPRATLTLPRFGPDKGALLLAFRQRGKQINGELLTHVAGCD
ncbi:MAG: BadF/BadG/BcrA/BcrD ATPase family protein [Blastocatellia bacterium]